jgi:site-specific recombinase XerD
MLRLIETKKQEQARESGLKQYGAEAFSHHRQLIEGYLQSHVTRNHSERSIAEVRRYLSCWFNEQGGAIRPLYVWEAMEPMQGRRRIVEYGKGLVTIELANSTIRRYLGHLRDFFSYVLAHPIVFDGEAARRITEIYGPMEQPVSEFDYPKHSYDGEQRGIPMDPERLYDFYGVLREKYLTATGMQDIRARNYSMAVLAGESGLRIDEILHLEISKDLFFESKKLQTRHAKGMRGSGKRSRPTLFTPLARDTLQFYLNHHRPRIRGAAESDYLFINRDGKKMDRKAVSEQLNNMVSSAQESGFSVMDHFSWHWFRRIFATRFIERFPDKLHVLIGLLGHVTPHTVHTYIRHSDAWSERMMQETLESINTHGYSLDF